METTGYIIERSNFGGPWKPHSVGQFIQPLGPRTPENFRRYTLAEATEYVAYSATLDNSRSGAVMRVTPADQYDQAKPYTVG